jgi:hypothetical protein
MRRSFDGQTFQAFVVFSDGDTKAVANRDFRTLPVTLVTHFQWIVKWTVAAAIITIPAQVWIRSQVMREKRI